MAAAIWLVVLAVGLIWALVEDLSLRDILAIVYNFVDANPLAPLVYIMIYGLRSFTLFPAMCMTIAAGSLFGFFPGIIWGLLGENLSASVAYGLARFLRSNPEKREQVQRLNLFRRLLVKQAFPTVIVLRASFLPFDLVNYGCGLLRVRWWPYLFGSMIGMLPPMLTFVSFGSAINFRELLTWEDFSPARLIDSRQLIISGALVLISIGIIFWAQRRQRQMIWRSKLNKSENNDSNHDDQ
ncbi:MAG TPA: VTT domain-containing protein [Salinisphaeraceae bacterium]|nr:VTT domain-containing protein [Salinisphaeraceae bacterium]